MPHQCVRCNTFYDDGAQEILKGCTCGGRLFFYVKKDSMKKVQEASVNLTKDEKKQIEKDVMDLVGAEALKEQPVVLDLESIKVLKPGKYQLDLVQLFNGKPLIYKVEDGKYIIDLPSSFQMQKEDE